MAKQPTIDERLDSIIQLAHQLRQRLPAHFEAEGTDDDGEFDDLARIDERLLDMLDYLDHGEDLRQLERNV